MASIDFSYNITSVRNDFGVYLYRGILTLSNIVLVTEPKFFYDVYLNFNIDDPNVAKPNYGNYFNTVNNGVFCNLSNKNIRDSVNITTKATPLSDSYSGYSFTGI